ncbi:methyltransferase-domain-containing protein [Hypoxylon rubiginosum]|uniref:Methyltransferase-domain-containing protein n=1 Tax=Hypoxylon rubiginosum TaxID=110542 RepID=A0ACB9YY96_9PEZI|nr:methyltransferase-domain-containing protein [Hypoxylon rubiginosum]
MFAVPGWSVSADSLKPETTKATSKPAPEVSDDSKKRKRPPPNVTASNVADLWERVIEGRSGKKARPSNGQDGEARHNGRPEGRPKKVTLKEKKKLKKLRELEASQQNGVEKSGPTGGNDKAAAAPDTAPSEAKEKKKKRSRDRKENGDDNKNPEEKASPPEKLAPRPAAAGPKLTPMQAQMREKLVSARFRHLNETLYTKPSADAFQLFADSPEMFQEYHEGFRRQVDVWPENPVDGYIEDIQQRGRQRPPQKSSRQHGRGHHSSSSAPNPADGTVVPLPRTGGTCTVADLGCGDAKLAQALQAEKKKLKLEVLSFDLQSGGDSSLVTKADIADLPLEDGGVNVVVFCLALMGTNWLDFVEEAYRVLHWKGELWVAEIKSRFGQVGNKTKKGGGGNAPVTHSVGNRRKTGPAPGAGAGGKKGKGKDAEAAEGKIDEAELAVEVDGADDRREETDVSAFVEALRKRGFVLQGEVDLRNKMFVKMHFLKAAPPSVGKGAIVPEKESTTSRGGAGPRKNGIKFLDAEEGQKSTLDEASILKPCVYKLR